MLSFHDVLRASEDVQLPSLIVADPSPASLCVLERECDLDKHCGVLDPDRKKICTRLLTCNVSPLTASPVFWRVSKENPTGSAGPAGSEAALWKQNNNHQPNFFPQSDPCWCFCRACLGLTTVMNDASLSLHQIHSIHQRRKVMGRSKTFDQLVAELKTKVREKGSSSVDGASSTGHSPGPGPGAAAAKEQPGGHFCRRPLASLPAFRFTPSS